MSSLKKTLLAIVGVTFVLMVAAIALGLILVLPIIELLSWCTPLERRPIDPCSTEKSDWLTAMTSIKNEMLYNIWGLFCCFPLLGRLGMRDMLPITFITLAHMLQLVVWIPSLGIANAWRWIANAWKNRTKRR